MDRYGARAATFCEQCGIHRDQLGDETIMPFRECATCGQAVCPNCWNIVAGACLKCMPFMLPDVAAPTDPRLVTTVSDDEGLAAAAISRTAALPKAALAPPLPVMGGTAVGSASDAPAPGAPEAKEKRGRRIKTPAILGAAAGTAKAKAKTIAPVAVTPATTPPITAPPTLTAPAVASATDAATAVPPASGSAGAAGSPKGRAKRPKLPALPTPKRSAAEAATAAAAASREVQWPDRSVDWQIRPGQPMPATPPPPAVDQQRPPTPVAAAAASRGTAPTAARPAAGRPARSGRLASLVGFLVVAVALFGVAGISLAALGRLPMGHRAVATIVPEPDTQAPAATSTDVLGTFPPIATPGLDGKVPHQVSGHGSGGGGGGNSGGGSGSTPRPDETVSGGGAGFDPTPKPTPTPTPTAAPTPTPTPDPTPTPTPDPTPTPTPDPTPTPTPDPTPSP